MSLPDIPSADTENYGVQLTSGCWAHSPAEALEIFWTQLNAGDVYLTVQNIARRETYEEERVSSALNLDSRELVRLFEKAALKMSAHERIETLAKLKAALEDI